MSGYVKAVTFLGMLAISRPSLATSLSRQDVVSNAQAYVSVSVTVSTRNLVIDPNFSTTCDDREDALGFSLCGGDSFSGEAYSYGGFDNTSSYTSRVAA